MRALHVSPRSQSNAADGRVTREGNTTMMHARFRRFVLHAKHVVDSSPYGSEIPAAGFSENQIVMNDNFGSNGGRRA
jgi:hypothetical protein